MSAERERRQAQAASRIDKLMTLANRHPNTPEGQSAKAKAIELAQQYDIDLKTLRPVDYSTGDPFLDRLKAAAKGGTAKMNPGYLDAFTDMFKSRFPGIDDEDYTKYARKQEERDDDT